MNYFDDAKALVIHGKQTLDKIKTAYNECLHEQIIKKSLLIEIKNFMENLRSALDYSAHGLYDKYGDKSKKADKIYFPYAWASLDQANFTAKNIIDQKIPGLLTNRPDIAPKLESYQHFASADNSWLPKFMDLNNENKHQQLTPQAKRETRQLNIRSGGVSISMGEGTSVNMGPGVFIQMGEAIIPGGQQFDVNNPPTVFGNVTKEIITWVSFYFTTNNELVLPLLTHALNGTEKIVTELSQL